MNLIHLLMGEHAALRTLLSHAREVADQGHAVPIDEMTEVLRRSLLAHARTEETLLFPIVPHFPQGLEAHSEQEEVKSWLAGDDGISPATRLSTAVDLARLHLEREEAHLFPRVLAEVDHKHLLDAGARWQDLRDSRLGKK